VSTALTTRTRILALFPPLAAFLLLVGEALTPKGLDHPISMSRAAKELPIAKAHLNQLYVSNLLVIFGLGALGVSFAAFAVLVRERGSTIATVAAVVGGTAGFCGGLGPCRCRADPRVCESGLGLRRGVRRLSGRSGGGDRFDDRRSLAKPRCASLAPDSVRARRGARSTGSRGNRLNPAAATDHRRFDRACDSHLENDDSAWFASDEQLNGSTGIRLAWASARECHLTVAMG